MGSSIVHNLTAGFKNYIDTAWLPIVPAEIIYGNHLILTMTFTNVGGQASPRITLVDGNGKSVVFYNRAIGPGSELMFEHPGGRPCIGGLTWSCDTANAVEGQIEYI